MEVDTDVTVDTVDSPPKIVLYIWPGQWGLPSFDPLCLASVLLLQVAVPGQFVIQEYSNPDIPPFGKFDSTQDTPYTYRTGQWPGQLPFLTHGQNVIITSYPAILNYIAGLIHREDPRYPHPDIDAHLSSIEKAQRRAWNAHVMSHLGDLVQHNFYSNRDNWTKMMHSSLASFFPIPQRYFVPRRMRNAYFPRFASVGLWREPVEEKFPETPFQRDAQGLRKEGLKQNVKLSQAFDEERVLGKARIELDIYQSLLEGKTFILGNQLSSLDILFASHIILLTEPPFPDPILKDFVKNSYPSIYAHAKKIYDSTALSVPLIHNSEPQLESQNSSTPEHHDKYSWGLLGAAIGSFVTYQTLIKSK